MNLREAKVLVTGGSSGIGFETARQLAEKGAKVAICGRDDAKLRKAAASIGVLPISADVAVEEDVRTMVRTVVAELGGYDVLINNAGFGGFSPLVEQDLASMTDVFATNVFGAMLVARESARHFVTQNRGNIVNIASTAGRKGFAGGTAYVASKFALVGMSECWRAELRKHNIRVMVVYPSEVQTEFFTTAGGARREPNESKLRPLEIAHAILGMLEMDDRGFVTDLAVWATNPT